MFANYYHMLDEEKVRITDVIQKLLNQTYIMERKYDRKTDRFLVNDDYRVYERNQEFLRDYFSVAEIELIENRQYNVIYIKTLTPQGDKISPYSTKFILLLKVIFDEQMSTVSNSTHIYTTLGTVNEKLQLIGLEKGRIPITEMRKTIAFLKKYQIIEVLDELTDLNGEIRLIINPIVNLLIERKDILEIIKQYQVSDESEEEDIGEYREISDDNEAMPE